MTGMEGHFGLYNVRQGTVGHIPLPKFNAVVDTTKNIKLGKSFRYKIQKH